MIITPENSTIDGYAQTPEEWEQYNIPAATIVINPSGNGHLRVPHRTDATFHRLRCNKPGYKPELRDGVWYWVMS